MFKSSLTAYTEVRACISSVANLKKSLPTLYVCQDCHHHLSSVRYRNVHTIHSIKPSSVLSGYFCLWPNKNVSGSIIVSCCFSNTPDKTNNPANESSSSDNVADSKQPDKNQSKATGQAAGQSEAATTGETADAERKKNKVLSVIPRMRKPNPIDYSYTGNIYILPKRALVEYLLMPSDIVDLPKYTRRSPYDDGTRITLYLRTDVEEAALKKWGDFDKLNKEKARLRNTNSDNLKNYDINDVRMLLGEMHSSTGFVNPDDPNARSAEGSSGSQQTPKQVSQEQTFWSSGSTKVVLSAIFVNGANSLFKLIAWLYTGSHSMFSEFIHSAADTVNQIILGFGLYHSFKKPDTDHPYGYRNLRHISSLISGVGIFFFGTGLSYYHSLQGFLHPTELGNLTWCVATLIGSFISEGGTLLIAIREVRRGAKSHEMGVRDYLMSGIDPNVNVVLLEDFAAVLGVGIAGVCISISAITGSSSADAAGSALIGTLLGSVAAFIIHQNTQQLVGRSIPEEERQEISQLLERDRMIRSLHDIKATQMGGVVRYKAEVDFDGKEITRAYLYKQDLDLMLAEAQKLKTVEELEVFMMNHGEKIIDALGAEVDRIEKSLKSKHPEIRHVDLEAL
ncbi:proton-coupled zinc antiporter SLC30A9, mitochondrial-like [Physella acuta]|uniref:proton-coupled zinc antiporter SLC30A9, mitochondrial-like n=1 Tax=Physella acuta TaxID=109671 RepID=UPI0027DDC400|nr:proton-coupled zinc antiporter SLC30A9, mitochondrial-like [Physella acuta]